MRVVIIANPAARGGTERLVDEVVSVCASRGPVQVAVHRTAGPGDATALAASTSDPDAVILAIGGDGTAREIVDGLAARPDPGPMFIVPAGTANSCYRSFWGDIPWPEALEQALARPAARTRRLDLARLAETGRLVLAGASTGFPPQAIHRAEALSGLSGRARYEHALAELAGTYEPYPGRVLVDGAQVHNGPTMLVNVGGSRYRGGRFEVLPHSVIDDGLLDVCVIGGEHHPHDMLALARTGEHVTRPGVIYARGRRITLERTDGRPLWFEHDGEPLPGRSPTFTLSVVPRAVPMLVGDAADLGRAYAA